MKRKIVEKNLNEAFEEKHFIPFFLVSQFTNETFVKGSLGAIDTVVAQCLTFVLPQHWKIYL